jgi:hypothetical protein
VLIEAPDYTEIVPGELNGVTPGPGRTEDGSTDTFASTGGGDSRRMMQVLGDLKKKLDPNGILPSVESAGLGDGCK